MLGNNQPQIPSGLTQQKHVSYPRCLSSVSWQRSLCILVTQGWWWLHLRDAAVIAASVGGGHYDLQTVSAWMRHTFFCAHILLAKTTHTSKPYFKGAGKLCMEDGKPK